MAPFLWLICFLGLSHAMYEDQAFKFDWRTAHIGKPDSGLFWQKSPSQCSLLFTSAVRSSGFTNAPGKNERTAVFSSLDADSGKILWRHVYEAGEEILDLSKTGKSVSVLSLPKAGQIRLRSWNPGTGSMIAESFLSLPDTKMIGGDSFISGNEVNLVMKDEENGKVKVHVYEAKNFEVDEEVRTATFSTGTKNVGISCIHTLSSFVCMAADMRMIYITPLPLQPKASFTAISLEVLGMLPDVIPMELKAVPGAKNQASISLSSPAMGETVMILSTEEGKVTNSNILMSKQPVVIAVTGCKESNDLFKLEQKCQDSECRTFDATIEIAKVSADFKKTRHLSRFTFKNPVDRLTNAWASCEANEDGDDDYQLVLETLDGVIVSLTPLSNEMWTRDESLASINTVELVATSLKDDDATYDSDSAQHTQDIDVWGQFVKRIKHHISLISSSVTHILEIRDLKALLIGDGDVNFDDFGLRKVVIAASDNGKLLGLDSKSGNIIWTLILPTDSRGSKNILVQRTALHYDFNAQAAFVYLNKHTNNYDVLLFNPLNGEVVEVVTGKPGFDQAVLIHQVDKDHLKPILLLNSKSNDAVVVPESAFANIASSWMSNSFFVTKESMTNNVIGHKLIIDKDEMKLSPVWTLSNPNTDWVTITGKSSEEIVHSQGRVMADRSVLFKYVNPNLALVMTEGKDSNDKAFINVYLVDLVSGRIVFSAYHKRVTGPYHVVHSENWVVYVYYNEKARRAELASIELFEGRAQSNSTFFSSLSDSISPMVERQAFILGPTNVAALKDTMTVKGITSKNVILATSSGALYNIPRHLLDPRRPNLNAPPEMREPGLPPYIPELQIPQDFIINYNQSVAVPRGISTAPTGLESTSIVFVFGLDLYCTRIAPSKSFDLLKDDFDYYIISVVLFGLIGAAIITRKLSQKKNLRQAWR